MKPPNKDTEVSLTPEQKSLGRCLIEECDKKRKNKESVQGFLEMIRLINKDPLVRSAIIDLGGRFFGRTALMSAAEWGHTETAKLLVEGGANVNARDDYYQTALMRAAICGHMETAKLLVEKGADVNAQDDSSRTALMIAAKRGHTETAKLLVEGDANVNDRDCLGRTALLNAAEWGHMETAKLLVEGGADTTLTYAHRGPNFKRVVLTADQIAKKAGHPKLAGFLREVRLEQCTKKLIFKNLKDEAQDYLQLKLKGIYNDALEAGKSEEEARSGVIEARKIDRKYRKTRLRAVESHVRQSVAKGRSFPG